MKHIIYFLKGLLLIIILVGIIALVHWCVSKIPVEVGEPMVAIILLGALCWGMYSIGKDLSK